MRVIGLVVMRCLHFPRAAILTQIAGFGKDVVPLFGLWIGHGVFLIRSHRMDGLWKHRGLRFGCKFVGMVFHELFFLVDWVSFGGGGELLRRTAKTEAIIRFQPVECGGLIRVQSKLVTTLNIMNALFRIFHRAFAFHVIRPVLNFRWRLGCAVGQQPDTDLVIIFRGFNSGCELLAGDALKTEELVVQRTIVAIFAERAGQTGAAFVHRPTRDGESADAFARTVRCLFG